MLEKLPEILKNNHRIFYKINNGYITYNDLYEQSLKLSQGLKRQGNGRVVIYGDKQISQVIAIIGCLMAKRCYVPLDSSIPYKRVLKMIEEAEATLILKSDDIVIDGIESLTIDELNKKYANSKQIDDNDNDSAYIIFTSGSTGTPKGVEISYHNLEHFIYWIMTLEEFKNCKELNVLSQSSFSFDLSLMDLYFCLYKQCTVFGIDSNSKRNINLIYTMLEREKINLLIMTPSFAKLLLLDSAFSADCFPSLKYMFFCGETLEIQLVRKIKNRFPEIKIINAYGPTEATCFVALTEIDNDMLNNTVLPVGKLKTAAVNVEIDKNEIIVKGDSVFKGYVNQTSNRVYQINGINCYKTGDRGYIRDGYLYCQGRLDNQIKYQGYRIDLNDIENNFLKIKEINEAVVICKYHGNYVRLIKAFVTVNADITIDYIKEQLSLFLPSYMVPKSIKILDKIPINKNGKYDRRALQKL